MVINRAGVLSKEYFISYIELVMNTRDCTLQQAKDIVFKRIFNGDIGRLGESSYQAFLSAYKRLSEA